MATLDSDKADQRACSESQAMVPRHIPPSNQMIHTPTTGQKVHGNVSHGTLSGATLPSRYGWSGLGQPMTAVHAVRAYLECAPPRKSPALAAVLPIAEPLSKL